MKFLLFISYNSGLRHNAVYENFFILQDSIKQLIEEERLNIISEDISTLRDLERHFEFNDDYFRILSNGTWFHIQELSARNYIKVKATQNEDHEYKL